MSGDAGSQANAHHCWQALCGIIVDPGKRACWPGLFARGQELVCFSSNVHRIMDGCLAGVRFIPWSWQRRARLAVRSDQTYLASSVYNLDPSPLALVSAQEGTRSERGGPRDKLRPTVAPMCASALTAAEPPIASNAARRPVASGCITPAPYGHTPGSACTKRLLCLPLSDSCSQMWCGITFCMYGPAVHAADHSIFGIARTSSDRFGVPECHTRWSRKIALPAGHRTQ